MSWLRLRVKAGGLISLVVAAALWQVLADTLVRNRFILPSFLDVLKAYARLAGSILLRDVAISLMHFALGLAMGLMVGVPVGCLMGWSRVMDQILDPLIEILRPIPPIAWVPLAIVWFHLTHFSAGFIVFIGAVFPILINAYTGFRGVEKRFVEAAEVLGCIRGWDLVRAVAFPSALPSILAGVRIGMGVGWMCVVAAEIFGVSENGLGFRIFQRFYYLHQTDNLIAYMILLGLLALLIDRGFRAITERLWLRWRVGAVIP